MDGMDNTKIKKLALQLALKAGALQMRKFRTILDIQWKAVTDPVTEVDKACEALIIRGIQNAFPTHAILGEESGAHAVAGAEYQWIIDPLDGTVNYSHGLPIFAVSIGIYHKGKPLVGVVHAPALRETFVAEQGKGAFCSGRRIHVSKTRDPLRSVLASGFAYQARESGENMREWMHAVRNFQAIRRMGSAALDLCYTAAGRFDAFWEYGLKPWDVAAAGLILTESGGKISNLQGLPYDMWKPGILGSNGRLHTKLLPVLARALKSKLTWPPR
jgi:myo-inositol-1(or 4)-monophosphatase